MEYFIISYIIGVLITPIIIKIKLKETWKGMWDYRAIPYIMFISIFFPIGIPVMLFTD
jgi:hypothetical protein